MVTFHVLETWVAGQPAVFGHDALSLAYGPPPCHFGMRKEAHVTLVTRHPGDASLALPETLRSLETRHPPP